MSESTATVKHHPRPGKALVEALVSADSYGAVLLSILITYAAAVSVTNERARTIVLVLQILTVWLTFRVAQSRPPVLRATNVLLGCAGLVALANLLGITGSSPEALLFAASCILYFVAPIAIIRHIVSRRIVDLETVLGAVAAYLLIGMSFAFAYRWLGLVQQGNFYGAKGDGTMPEDLFFSFTTMTTIGFGNLVPGGNPGQTFAVAEGLFGQLFLVVAVAKVVSAWRPGISDVPPPED